MQQYSDSDNCLSSSSIKLKQLSFSFAKINEDGVYIAGGSDSKLCIWRISNENAFSTINSISGLSGIDALGYLQDI